MCIFVFDTETTGFPPHCHLVQIAWHMYDADTHALIEKGMYYARPDGWDIPAQATAVHGITTDFARKHGVPIDTIWDRMRAIVPKVTCVVAHNLSFDDRVMLAHMPQDLVSLWKSIPLRVCTMRAGTRGREKWPKLLELYERCFGALGEEERGRLHQADMDVDLCAKIYFHLLTVDRVV